MLRYPFILLILLFLARSAFIDNWNWTPLIIATIMLPMFILIYFAIGLFRDAHISRKKVIEQLNDGLYEAIISERNTEDKVLERDIGRIKSIINEIQNIKIGAFVPLSYNPVLMGSLTNVGSFGIISLLSELIS